MGQTVIFIATDAPLQRDVVKSLKRVFAQTGIQMVARDIVSASHVMPDHDMVGNLHADLFLHDISIFVPSIKESDCAVMDWLAGHSEVTNFINLTNRKTNLGNVVRLNAEGGFNDKAAKQELAWRTNTDLSQSRFGAFVSAVKSALHL